MFRRILGVIVGLVAGIIVIALVESVSSMVYPLPAELDRQDPAALQHWIAQLPLSALLWVLGAHAVGAFTGGLTCAGIVRQPWQSGSVILGSLFLLAGVANLAMLPHPLWLAIADLLLYLPAALLGGRLGTPRFSGRSS